MSNGYESYDNYYFIVQTCENKKLRFVDLKSVLLSFEHALNNSVGVNAFKNN